MSLFDHIGFSTRHVARSLAFYESCMPALGLVVTKHNESNFFVSGGERAPVPFIWVHANPALQTSSTATTREVGRQLHLMFAANSRDAVEAFYQYAIKAGGKENGAPGFQGPAEMGYYAALVSDPDGNTIEAGYRQRKR